MKILHIITGLDIGGAEKILLDTVKKMKQDHTIEVIYLKTEAKMKQQFIDNNIIIKKSPIGIFSFFKLIIKIRKNNYDIVHTHLAHANFIGRMATLLANKKTKIYTTIHNTENWIIKDRKLNKFFNFLDSWISSNKRVSLIFISKEVEKFTRNNQYISNIKTKIIPNAIDIKQIKLKSLSRDKNNEKIIKYLKKEKNIICVGRLEKQKGFDVLIHALSKISKETKLNLNTLIIGEGSEKDSLGEQIEELGLSSSVHLVGALENPYEIIRYADLFIIPSRWEGFGIVALEAMILRKPLIVSNVGGLKELVSHNVNGYVFENENYEDLSEKIIEMFKDNLDKEKMLNIGETLAENYSIEKYIKSLEEYYME